MLGMDRIVSLLGCFGLVLLAIMFALGVTEGELSTTVY